jgi:transposase
MGIDEIAVKKGYSGYLTIISSHLNGGKTILKVIEGKKKEDVISFLKTIPKPLRKTTIAVCTDMYDGYINAAKAVFSSKVPIVIDRFHVANLYRDCLTKLRIKELKRLRKKLTHEQYQLLKEPIAILQKNSELITEEDRKKLTPLFKKSPDLKRAYRLCRKITSIFNSHIPKRSASKRINNWINDVHESNLIHFKKVSETFKDRQKEIVNYFKDRQNSGFVEGINNKIKVTKRRCYGLSEPKTFFLRLFLDFSGYETLGVSCA